MSSLGYLKTWQNLIKLTFGGADQNIVWYGILHAILIFSSLLDWNLKEEEYFLLTFHKLLDSSLLKLLLCINFTS